MDEELRLNELEKFEIIGTNDQDLVFDNITILAAHVANTKMSLVSFADSEKFWFKSRYNFELPQVSRNIFFCEKVLESKKPIVIQDLSSTYQDTTFVKTFPNIKFYASFPIISNDYVIGTLCLLDNIPLVLSEIQCNMLSILVQQLVSILDLYRIQNIEKQENDQRYCLDLTQKISDMMEKPQCFKQCLQECLSDILNFKSGKICSVHTVEDGIANIEIADYTTQTENIEKVLNLKTVYIYEKPVTHSNLPIVIIFPVWNKNKIVSIVEISSDDVFYKNKNNYKEIKLFFKRIGNIIGKLYEKINKNQTTELVETLIENVDLAIYACDENGKITTFNKNAQIYHNTSLPFNATVFSNIDFNIYDMTNKKLENSENPFFLAYKGVVVRNLELVVKPYRKEKRILCFNGQSYFDKNGNRLGTVLSASDITLVKKAQMEMEKLVQEKIKIMDKNQQEKTNVILSKRLLEQSAVMKTEFLTNLSHELRTPITAITGITELLLDTVLDTNQQESVVIIKKSTNALLYLIDKMLDFSIVQKTINKINLIFNFHEFLQSLEHDIKIICLQKGCNVVIEIFAQHNIPDEIIGDQMNLYKILINFAENSLIYTKSGYFKINVQLILVDEKYHFLFNIMDNGEKINVENESVLFEAFSASDKKRNGAGLELSIARNLILQLDGSVGLIPSKNRPGATFWFTLPFDIPPHDSVILSNLAKDIPKLSFNKTFKILVAEDNIMLRKIIEKQINKLSAYCKTVENGKLVIEMLEKENFDLILMDCQMPVMNGIEATEIIRNSKKDYANIPIVALTANAVQGQKEFCLEVGMNDFVTKPLDLYQLSHLLRKYKSDE